MPKKAAFHKGHNLPRESYPDIPYMLRQQATKSPVKKQTSQFDQKESNWNGNECRTDSLSHELRLLCQAAEAAVPF